MREKTKQTKTKQFDVHLVVTSNGTVFPHKVDVEHVRKVTFHPQGSKHVITVKFVDRVPFKDWRCSVRTGDPGETLSGRMRQHAQDEYKFQVFTHEIKRSETDGQPETDRRRRVVPTSGD